MADLESSSSTNSLQPPLSPERSTHQSICQEQQQQQQQQQQQTPIRSIHSNPSQLPQHTSRIPLAPITSQQTTHSLTSQTSILASQTQKLNLSPLDLLPSSNKDSPTRLHINNGLVHNANNHKPSDSPPSPSSHPLGMSGSSHTEMAATVPAWIKAVRNADEKKQEYDGDSPPSVDSVSHPSLY
jgi:hypothetical protein